MGVCVVVFGTEGELFVMICSSSGSFSASSGTSFWRSTAASSLHSIAAMWVGCRFNVYNLVVYYLI